MLAKEHLEGQWREWRHARVATLSRPYGWPSLVAQHWLHEGGEPTVLDGLPGRWVVDGGRVMYLPPEEGPNLVVDGVHPAAPIEIVPGRNMVYGNGASVPVYFGACEIETIVRTDDEGERIYAVRVRDPEVAATKDFSRLESYGYDIAWRLPAVYAPTPRRDIETVTVERGVRETTTHVGTLAVQIAGAQYELVVMGKETPTGVQAVVHVRDETNGDTSYGAGRVVDLEIDDVTLAQDVEIDFNFLHPLPCAFTNFVTCPLPPPQNIVRTRIEAGEKKPAETIERVSTYA
ncbi:MAG: DUF1684 domain-containing protein [Microbacterium sp.]